MIASGFVVFSLVIALGGCLPDHPVSLEQMSDYTLKGIVLPELPPCHVQGLKLIRPAIFVSCADQTRHRALLYRIADPEPVQKADLTEGARYHPSGMDYSQGCLWVAVAEYRPHSNSRILCLDPDSLTPRTSFEVKDHIGALAVAGDHIVGWNWDSRQIYLWDLSGRELDHGRSPFGVAYQDCKAVDSGVILCSGIKSRGRFFFRQGVVDRILANPDSVQSFRLLERRVIQGRSRAGHHLTREAFDFSESIFYFIPDDLPEAKVYAYPSVAPPKEAGMRTR